MKAERKVDDLRTGIIRIGEEDKKIEFVAAGGCY